MGVTSIGSVSIENGSSAFDVAVIGGGIVGLSIAWRAAERGMSVALLERGEPGGGASGVAAGMLAPVCEAEFGAAGRELLELGMRSAAMWPDFAEELQRSGEQEVGLRRTGTLVVARDDDEARELERQLEFRLGLGLRAERLRASEVREREPALAPTVRLGLHAPDDHCVDPRRVVAALRRACEREGVSVRRGEAAVRCRGDRVEGVSLRPGGAGEGSGRSGALTEPAGGDVSADGPGGDVDAGGAGASAGAETIDAPVVVAAAGAWSGELAGLPAGVGVAVRPVKGQIMRLRDPTGPGLLEGVLRFQGGYLVPRGDGAYVLGATMEERGFEPGATAGGVYRLLRDAHELVPGVSELRIEEVGFGYRPGSPDNVPIVGRSTLDGLLWATGHHRNGVLLAPLTAATILEELVSG